MYSVGFLNLLRRTFKRRGKGRDIVSYPGNAAAGVLLS